eukprot:scaffold6944_cov118-Isochrysis_galbana.AAC.6
MAAPYHSLTRYYGPAGRRAARDARAGGAARRQWRTTCTTCEVEKLRAKLGSFTTVCTYTV